MWRGATPQLGSFRAGVSRAEMPARLPSVVNELVAAALPNRPTVLLTKC
jgi:hypothetical protein